MRTPPSGSGARRIARTQGLVAISYSVLAGPPLAVSAVAPGDFCSGVSRFMTLVGACLRALCSSGVFSFGVARSIMEVGGCFWGAFLVWVPSILSVVA